MISIRAECIFEHGPMCRWVPSVCVRACIGQQNSPSAAAAVGFSDKHTGGPFGVPLARPPQLFHYLTLSDTIALQARACELICQPPPTTMERRGLTWPDHTADGVRACERALSDRSLC